MISARLCRSAYRAFSSAAARTQVATPAETQTVEVRQRPDQSRREASPEEPGTGEVSVAAMRVAAV